MFKQNLLFLIFYSCFLLSCEQNPLKGIPPELHKGVFETGNQHINVFNESLYDKLVKVDILNQSDLLMEFKEGQRNIYPIKIRLLHGLEKRYKLDVSLEKLELLKELTWSFNPENNTIILDWKPSKIFAGKNLYRKISIPLILSFKDHRLSSSEVSFVLKKELQVIVQKQFEEPEVYRIVANHGVEYIKLDDGNFYSKYGAKKLNLKYFDSVFVGDIKKKKIFDNVLLYSHQLSLVVLKYVFMGTIEDFLRSMDAPFDKIKLFNSYKKPVPVDTIVFLKQPFYLKDETSSECEFDEDFKPGKDESQCFNRLSENNIDFDTNIYVKMYQTPECLTTNSKCIKPSDFFYKVKDPILCKLYHHISAEAIIHKRLTPYRRDLCYLSSVRSAKINNNYYKMENSSFYVFRGDQFEPVDRSQWTFSFYKIPEYIKWQLGGYRPIEDILVNLKRINETNLLVYVKDYNNFDKHPSLVPYQQAGRPVFWKSSIIKSWKFISARLLKHSDWELSYSINLERDFNGKNSGNLTHFDMDFHTVSETMSTKEPTPFLFNIPPVIKAKYIEDANFYQKKSASVFVLGHKMNFQWNFPAKFISNVQKIIPFKKIPLYKVYSNDQKISDYVRLGKLNVNAKTSCLVGKDNNVEFKNSDETIDEYHSGNKEGGYKIKSSCKCLGLEEKLSAQSEGVPSNFILENTCWYDIKVETPPSSSILQAKDKDSKSSYVAVDHFLDIQGDVYLRNIFYKDSSTRDIRLDLKKEFFIEKEGKLYKKEKKPINSKIHLFFNLQPDSMECVTSTEHKNRTCDIKYAFDQHSHSIRSLEYFRRESGDKFFSDNGVQVHFTCPDNPTACSCENRLRYFREKEIVIQCLIKQNYQGKILTWMTTKNPYIYFIDSPDLEVSSGGNFDNSSSADDYRKTSIKSWNAPGEGRN